MSTERPDNDATDPVEGHARGPVEGPAEDAVAGPADAADETVEGSVDGTTHGTGADSGEVPSDVTVEGTAEASVERPTEGAVEGPGERSPEAAPGDPGDGSTGGAAEGSGAGPAENSAERGIAGSDAGPGEAAVGGHAKGPGDASAEPPGEDGAERPVEDPAEAAAETPADSGVAGSAESGVTGPIEGAVGSPAEGHAEGHADGHAEGTLDGYAEDTADGHAEGTLDGQAEDTADGHAEGTLDGYAEGTVEDTAVGHAEGTLGGHAKGVVVSPADGSRDGHAGDSLGGAVPEIVGGPVEGAAAGGVRRRRSPAVVASVVAAVLLVGGGGAYFAATASGGGRSGAPGADGNPPPLALDGYAANTGATGGTAGIAPGEPNPYGATYRADGTLPTGPNSAHVQWAEGSVTRAEVARLAKALDLAGTPRLVGDAWTVGTAKDGAEPNLRVNADAPGTWTFSSYIPGTDNCAKGKMCRPIGSGSLTEFAPPPVSEAAARKAAAPVLKAVGQDDAKLDASQLMGRVRVVNADPVVGGLPTYGWTTGLQINVDGHVIGGSGQLKTPVEGDAYPVVGARKTLDLMNGSASATGDRRMGIGGCASPVPLKDRDEMPCEHPTPAPRPESVTVVKATFGLAAHRANGRQALVPSWLFEVRSPGADNTYTVTHPAVAPKFLASPASSAQPSPDPTVPPNEPSSPAATRDVDVQGYTADGKDLTVSFTGGVCADYTASASESSGKVTVTVTEKPWKNRICILIAKIYEKTVHLDEPLDGRTVVGTDGKAIHHGSFDTPEPSGATSGGAR
ncbi:hypothetical protein [Streptomyces sp. NPDC005784]|uniref:hypothetical protein n=1 Tax=Streptomyces sp. NPDC005784 TaxID=3364731 RepID=UPI0036C4BB4F